MFLSSKVKENSLVIVLMVNSTLSFLTATVLIYKCAIQVLIHIQLEMKHGSKRILIQGKLCLPRPLGNAQRKGTLQRHSPQFCHQCRHFRRYPRNHLWFLLYSCNCQPTLRDTQHFRWKLLFFSKDDKMCQSCILGLFFNRNLHQVSTDDPPYNLANIYRAVLFQEEILWTAKISEVPSSCNKIFFCPHLYVQ